MFAGGRHALQRLIENPIRQIEIDPTPSAGLVSIKDHLLHIAKRIYRYRMRLEEELMLAIQQIVQIVVRGDLVPEEAHVRRVLDLGAYGHVVSVPIREGEGDIPCLTVKIDVDHGAAVRCHGLGLTLLLIQHIAIVFVLIGIFKNQLRVVFRLCAGRALIHNAGHHLVVPQVVFDIRLVLNPVNHLILGVVVGCPLGIDRRWRSDGHAEIKGSGTGSIRIPACKGEAFLIGLPRLLCLLIFSAGLPINKLAVDRCAAVAVKDDPMAFQYNGIERNILRSHGEAAGDILRPACRL